jgi:hypothetical protein
MIAISYRREDSLPVAGRLYDRLQTEFGKGNVFMDFDSIPYGVDFRDHIRQMIDRSKVLVAIIGPNWMGKHKHRGRRIDEPTDFVRLEIAYALERRLPIIPILVSNTQMPRSEELPTDIAALAFRNGLSLDVGIDFHHHAERLVGAINRILTTPPPVPPVDQSARQQAPPREETSPAKPETSLEKSVEPPRPEVVIKASPSAALALPLKPSEPAAPERTPPPIPPSEAPGGEKVSQPTAPTELPKLIGKPQTPITPKASARPSWTVRFRKSISHLQDRVMADYFRPKEFGPLRKKTFASWNRKKIAGFFLAFVFLAIVVAATWYWEQFLTKPFTGPEQLAEKTKSNTPTQTQTAEKSREQMVPRVPQPLASPSVSAPPVAYKSAAPTVSSILKGTPSPAAPREGMLRVDSTPWGLDFEVIDAKGNHRSGVTPAVVSLALGAAQVIYKNGNQEHRETVSIGSGTWCSVGWTVSQQSPPAIAQRTPSPVPTSTPAVASAPAAAQPAPTAVRPIASGTPTQAAQVSPAQIEDFVKQFVSMNQTQDVDKTLAFYSPKVDYFGDRGKTQDYIRRDIQKYNGQWPARRDSIDGDIHVEEKVPNQQYRADFKLNLYAENTKSAEWSKGEMATTLDMNIIDGVPKIVAINQKRLQRQSGRGKGPRPPDMEPPGPIKPTKLTKVVIKKYGFSAMLPAELFPDAEARLADGATDRLNSLKGCATVTFGAPHEDVRKVFDDYVNQFRTAPDHRTIDYKVMKETWFVVSGSSKTTGYYVKGVRHGDDVFVMELDYVGAVCRIPASMVADMSHAFNGETEAALASTNPSPSPGSTPAGSGGEKIEPKLVSIHIRSLNCSVSVPIEIFPDAVKLTNGENRVVSTDGSTSLEFSHIAGSLAQQYERCATEEIVAAGQKNRHVQYKLLKDSWFVVSGTDASGVGGFYWKGIRAPTGGVNLMRLNYPENSTPLSDETLTAISRSFTGK